MKWYYYLILGTVLAAMAKKDAIIETAKDMSGTATPKGQQQEQVKKALELIMKQYGKEKAAGIEQLLRWETNHFKSGQWTKGNTAGMEIAKGKYLFPFGWSSLAEFSDETLLKPSDFSTYDMTENGTGKTKTFIKFPSAYMYVMFLVFLMNKRKWNFGSWYSTQPEKQASYLAKIQTVKPRFVNSIT